MLSELRRDAGDIHSEDATPQVWNTKICYELLGKYIIRELMTSKFSEMIPPPVLIKSIPGGEVDIYAQCHHDRASPKYKHS